MALNFPSSPTIGQIYTDSVSGFSYKWNGTVWISFNGASSSQIKLLDDISGSFTGVGQTFALTSNTVSVTPITPQSLIINLGGVIQDATDDYSISGSNIVFSTPPTNGLSFSGISLGPAVPVSTILDGTVTDGSLTVAGILSTSNLFVTGISTLGNTIVGGATTQLIVTGNARVTGIITVGTSSITLDGVNNRIAVGSGLTITESGITIGPTTINSSGSLSGTAGTITTFNSTSATITNGTITNLTGTAGTITNGNITNLTGTAGTITTFNSTNGTITNLTGTAGTITNFNSTNGTITNGTITNLTGTAGTITTFNGTTGTITTFNSTNGTITNLTGTAGTITNGTITNLAGTAGTITTFNSTNGTITNLTGTAGTITTFNSTNGTITNLTGTAGTITTFNSTNGTITNLTGTAGTITNFNSTNGTITNLTGTAGTITNFNSTNGTLTNINSTGISTLTTAGVTNLTTQQLNVTGISTLGNTIVGGGTTQLVVNGNARITGILTVGTGSITLDGSTNTISGITTINTTSINGGPLAGMRNAIINGNFDIWQRGTSFTGLEYGADRWVNVRVGTACTMARISWALGAAPGENGAFACRLTVGSVAGAGNASNLAQRIEGVSTFAGQQVTISFWAKADASKPIAVDLQQFFGSGGSPSATVDGIGATKFTISTTWTKYTVTATIPSVLGKTLGSDGNDRIALRIWFDAGSNFNSSTNTLGQQSGTFDISQVQLEPGPVATPFERRPIGTELALCQRYFCKSYNPDVVAGTVTDIGRLYVTFPTAGSGAFGVPVQFPVPMRAAPTFTSYNPVNGASGGARRGGTNKTGVSAINIGFNACSCEIPGTESSDNGSYHFIASAELP